MHIKALIEHNAEYLKRLYERQRRLAMCCRAENASVAAFLADRDGSYDSGDNVPSSAKEPSQKVLVFDAYLTLQRAVGRLSGKPVASPCDYVSVDTLRALIATAESRAFAAECAQHLAELDRMRATRRSAADPRDFASTHTLAGLEAANLRDAAAKDVLGDLIEKAKAIVARDEVVQPPSDVAAVRNKKAPSVAERIADVFEMGYVGQIWLGIENALPRGVERMSDEMARASIPDWVAKRSA